MNLEISLRSHIKLVSDGRQVTRRQWLQNTQVQPNPYGSCFVQSGDDFISLVIPSNKLVLIAIKEWGNYGSYLFAVFVIWNPKSNRLSNVWM